MQDSIINEGEDPLESFDCYSPKSDDETKVLELKDNVILELEAIVVEANYNPLLEVFKDVVNILDSKVRNALKNWKIT